MDRATNSGELPSGTVTFLMTDIEGSTKLWESNPSAMDAAVARHDEILAESVDGSGGVLLKHRGEGDSAFAVFSTAHDALSAAVAAQLALGAERWPGDLSLRVRMALHSGEARPRDGDYFGSAVTRTARLRELGHGGQILLSEPTAHLATEDLPPDVDVIDLGEHQLRDIARAEWLFQVGHPLLRREFPPPRSRQVATSIVALLYEGAAAYRRGEAEPARLAYEQALEHGESGEALEGLAKAIHLLGDHVESMRVYERAYAAYRREMNLLGAARAARTLGWFRGSLLGDWAVYRGWIERARSLLQQAGDDGTEHGWLLVADAQAGSDLNEQRERFLAAIDTARRCGDSDLECEALASLGIMLVLSGYAEDGLAYLDAALAAVCAGDVEELSVVEGTFCGLFTVCDRTNDVARAEQWLRAADEVVRRRRLVAIGGYCRAHYGGLLTTAGRWAEAESELLEAIRILASGELHLRAPRFVGSPSFEFARLGWTKRQTCFRVSSSTRTRCGPSHPCTPRSVNTRWHGSSSSEPSRRKAWRTRSKARSSPCWSMSISSLVPWTKPIVPPNI